jgi:predicted porin
MKKTLIVAAVSALTAGAALAQSSVTIYGRFNDTLERIDSNGTKTSQLVNNASRIGFKGTEDLGRGLKANFILEHGFSADTGAAASQFWGRQSELNLSGGFGTVRLGNFVSEAYFATADYVSMHNHDTGDSSDAFYAYIGRNTNKVAYRTPEFVKGLSLEAAVSAGEGVKANASGSRLVPRTYDFAVNYAIGGLALGAGYEKNGDAKQFAVRALYETGPVAFGGYIQRDTDGYGAGFGDRTSFRVSGAYTLGASEFHLNFGAAGAYSNVKDSKGKQFTAGYNYNLSKRTKVYGYYTVTDADKAGLYTGGVGKDGKGKFSALALGVRHNF